MSTLWPRSHDLSAVQNYVYYMYYNLISNQKDEYLLIYMTLIQMTLLWHSDTTVDATGTLFAYYNQVLSANSNLGK